MQRGRQVSQISGAGKVSAKGSNSSSDEDGDGWHRRNEPMHKRRRKVRVFEDDSDEEENEVGVEREERDSGSVGGSDGEEGNQEELEELLKPTGDVVRVSGSGVRTVNHYKSFYRIGEIYDLEDSVLLSPEKDTMKPYVAIIKDITHNISNGDLLLIGQCLYRPAEAKKKEGGSWQACDSRELFYSFHLKEFAAGTVMHKCVMNFVPLHKQLPYRIGRPGFIVQKVYDIKRKMLFSLTDKEFKDAKRLEIDLLVNETMERLGDLPDLDITLLRERNLSHVDESEKDEGVPNYHAILVKFRALTKDSRRNGWLEKLLQSVEHVFTSSDAIQEVKENGGYSKKGKNELIWPDSAVRAVTALERASYDTLSDLKKYNPKMRELFNNMKNSTLLAQRLLKQELKPLVILKMASIELKEGLTAEEIQRNKPEEITRVQMTDARCKSCSEKQVIRANSYKTGATERYEMSCFACGYSWYISMEDAATLNVWEKQITIENTGATSLDTTKLK